MSSPTPVVGALSPADAPAAEAPMDAETVLTTTRAVRRKLDLDRPVEQDVLEHCLRVAQQAPAAGQLIAALRWLVVRDPALKAEIGRHVREVGHAMHAKLTPTQPDPAIERRMASAAHLLEVIDRVPVLVIPCMLGTPEGPPAVVSGFYGSAYPAIWSFQLALRARGLGSTMVHYHLFDRAQQVAELLGIPENVTQMTLIPVAYTTTTRFSPAHRPPLGQIAYADRWGEPFVVS